MKIDGAEIARAKMKKKENMEFEKEGHKSEREQEEEGGHIKAMASFIEAIHHKEPEKAHDHMMDYAKKVQMMKDVKAEV